MMIIGVILVSLCMVCSHAGFKERPQFKVIVKTTKEPPLTTPAVPTPRPAYWVKGNTTGMFILQQPTLEEKLNDLWPPWGVKDIYGVIWFWHKGSLIRDQIFRSNFRIEYEVAKIKVNCKPGRIGNRYKAQLIYCRYFNEIFKNRFRVQCPPQWPPLLPRWPPICGDPPRARMCVPQNVYWNTWG